MKEPSINKDDDIEFLRSTTISDDSEESNGSGEEAIKQIMNMGKKTTEVGELSRKSPR